MTTDPGLPAVVRERLAELMRRRQLSARDLAARLGFGTRTLNAVLSGELTPPRTAAVRLFAALELHPSIERHAWPTIHAVYGRDGDQVESTSPRKLGRQWRPRTPLQRTRRAAMWARN